MNNIARLERLHAFAYGDALRKRLGDTGSKADGSAIAQALEMRGRRASIIKSVRAYLPAGVVRRSYYQPSVVVRNGIARGIADRVSTGTSWGGNILRSDAIDRLRRR